MQDKKLTVEDIAIPETVEVAIMQWWNSPVCGHMRSCDTEEAVEHIELATDAVKVALLSLATNPPLCASTDFPKSAEYLAERIQYWFPGSQQLKKQAVDQMSSVFSDVVGEYFSRIAFLRKPDSVPEEIKALMWVKSGPDLDGPIAVRHDADIIAAFNLGKEARDADKH